jgi:two-component system, OmpR family, sensor histidine kinase CiaH
MFERARLKLTAWYLLIIMTISLLFSFAIYSSIDTELHRFERMQIKFEAKLPQTQVFQLHSPDHFIRFVRPDPEIIDKARQRLIFALALINISVLLFAGAAGHFLAGRTLRPIKKMVDEQHRFITDASHELRTPITSLRSEIEVGLRNKKLTLSDAKKLLQSNLEEVIHLHTLSDNLLELAQNGKIVDPGHFERFSLVTLIDKAIKKVEPLATKKQITINSQITETTLLGTQDRLLEVFVILLDNAIKYSPKKSGIIISSKSKKGTVSISVIDQGVGIAKEDLPHIFERFFRVSKSRDKTKVSGYGLGLAIAKKIVEAHSGTIQVRSKQAKGTTFTINLPI